MLHGDPCSSRLQRTFLDLQEAQAREERFLFRLCETGFLWCRSWGVENKAGVAASGVVAGDVKNCRVSALRSRIRERSISENTSISNQVAVGIWIRAEVRS